MKVTLDPDLFVPPVQHTLLVALLRYPIDERHRVDVDTTNHAVAAWLAAQHHGLREEIEFTLWLSERADPTAVERAFEQLIRAAELMRDRCGIQSWNLVPYPLQGVLLADALRIAGNRAVHDILSDWFWITTYGEMFEGISGHRIGRAVRDLRQTMSDGQLRWSGPRPFQVSKDLPSVDFHAARTKAVALLLAHRIKQTGSRASVCSGRDSLVTLAAYGSGSLFPLVPRDRLEGPLFFTMGNHFLCHPDEAVELRRRLLTVQLDENERAAHVIPDAALEAAQRGDWSSFVRKRLAEIAALERGFIGEVLARHPRVSSQEIA